jgi:DNA-binding MarR family transcriptional regulator
MTISNLKHYLQQREQASLSDIANHFGAEQGTVAGMLEHWRRRGRIDRFSAPKCEGCNNCGGAMLELYRWVG